MEPRTTHLSSTTVRVQPAAAGFGRALNSFVGWIALPGVLIRAVLLLTFAAYVRTIAFDFVWDDNTQISMNSWLQSWRYVPLLFTRQVWGFYDFHTLANYYRPVFMLWLFLIEHLTGGAPGWFHLATIAVHLGVVLEVYGLARMLTRDVAVATLAALIFGLHPAKVEAVAWIAGGSEPLYALFMFATVICWFRWEREPHRHIWLLATLASFSISLLAKETAVLTPVLLAIYACCAYEGAAGQRIRRAASRLWMLGALIGVYLIWRWHVLHGLAQTSLMTERELKTTLLSMPLVSLWYIRHLVWPIGLSAYYDPVTVGRFSFGAVVIPGIALLILGLLLWRAVRGRASAAMLFWWFPLTLAPVIASVMLLRTHDRYLYVPSFPFAVGIAWLLLRGTAGSFPATKTARAAVIGAITIALAAGTLVESRCWDNDVALFQRATAKAPSSMVPRLALAGAYLDKGQPENARKALQEILSRFPNELRAWELLGTLEYEQKHLDAAHAAFTRGLATPYDESSKDFTLYSLGLVAQAQGDLPAAEQWYRRSIAASPGSAGAHQALAVVLTLESRRKQAAPQDAMERGAR